MDLDEEFAAYAHARWTVLVRSAVFLGCSLEEAQDLAQVTLLRCYQRWHRVQKAENRDAYVYRVLVNCLRDSRRRRWWGEQPTSDLPEVAGAVDQSELIAGADAVHRAVEGLSARGREVVVLRYFGHLTDQEIADVLCVPVGTVKSRLSRAHLQLAASNHLTEFAEEM